MFFRYFSFVFTLFFTISSVGYAVTGAGVLTFFDDGTVLLGKERRRNGYVFSDFGGKTDPGETLAITGWREGNEETAGTLKKYITLARVKQAEANGHYVDHNHAASGLSYRMYFIRIHGQKPSIATFHQNAASVKKRLGRNAHVDKSDWKYFDASIVMNAHNQQGNLPGTNEPVYGPMKACLRQPVTQQFFRNFINSVQNSPRPQKKIAPPSTRKPSPKIKQTHKVTRKVTPRIKATHKVTRKITPRIKPTHKVKRKGVTKIKQTHKVRKMSSAKIKRNHRTNKRTAYKRSKISQRRWRR